MEETNQEFLVTEKIGTLMRKYAVPCIISLLVGVLYNIVDQIFIANADYLGSYGNAANSAVFPLTVIALAFAVMIGDGCCAFVSQSLGAGRKEQASKSVGNGILLCIAVSAVLTSLYLLFDEALLTAFGGKVNNETFVLSKEYFFWITLGMPFYIFGQAMNPIIRSDGNPRFAMIAISSGAIANIILDPIFIYPLKMDMTGAAVATVIGQALTAVLSLMYLFRMKTIRLTKSDFGFYGKLMKRFLPLGLTSLLAQLSLAASQNMCAKYSAVDPIFSHPEYIHIPLAALGIVMKFSQIALSTAIGLAAGCIPIVAYNVGAGRNDRIKQLLLRLLVTEAIIGFAVWIVAECFPHTIAELFGAGNESVYYTEFVLKSFRIYLCMIPLAMVNKGTFIYLQALGRAGASILLSMTREIVFGVSLPIILPMFLQLDGLLLSFPTVDILTFVLSVIVIVKVYKSLKK